MIISGKQDFINLIQSFNIQSDFVIVKPNWVDIEEGNYTEAQILDWLFESLPNQKKIVVESFTPWRGLKYGGGKELRVNLTGGKEFWDFYKKQDQYFLDKTGLGRVLDKFNAEYINVTDEFWKGKMVPQGIIKDLVEKKHQDIYWTDFYSYIPQKLFDIRNQSTFISLAKIKLEEKNEQIIVSLSIKNTFGLIPHPSRRKPFHNRNHSFITQAIIDINKIYITIFPSNLWINEGILSLVKNYCEDNQFYEKNKNLVFVNLDPVEADSAVCRAFNIDPAQVPYLERKNPTSGVG